MRLTSVVVLIAAFAACTPIFAADKTSQAANMPADNMEVLRAKLKAEKKQIVARNMNLTDDEAKKFWPVYDAYQNSLARINKRLIGTIATYADAYPDGVYEDLARKLVRDYLAIETDYTDLKRDFVPVLSKALPISKVARYLQIETKFTAVRNYELAASIPLVE